MDEKKCQEKVHSILDFQFDLEIMLKYRELKIISQEIQRGEEILSCLDQLSIFQASHDEVPIPSTSLDIRTRSGYRLPPIQSAKSALKKKPERILKCFYEMSSEGIYCKLSCPECGKDRFGSLLGFHNHCRIVHELIFQTPEERLEKCGTPVELSDVPEEFRNRSRENEKYERGLALLRTSLMNGGRDLHDKKPEIKIVESEEQMFCEESYVRDDLPFLKEPVKLMEEIEENGRDTIEPISPEVELELESDDINEFSCKTQKQETIDLDIKSRFYIRKSVIIGNIVKAISGAADPFASSLLAPRFTYKWKLYLKEAENDTPVEEYISSIRFYLHPSYRPNDVVEAIAPPFTLTRKGWGEFPIRLHITFIDPKNKPIDIIHQLQFNNTKNSVWVAGTERRIDIELDKDTQFVPFTEQICKDLDILQATENNSISNIADTNLVIAEDRCKEGPVEDLGVSLDALHDIISSFPIIKNAHIVQFSPVRLTYRPASSLLEFRNWSHAKKKAVEWHRAKMVNNFMLVNSSGLTSFTTKQTVLWCRQNGYTPDLKPTLKKKESKQFYCRFCGKRVLDEKDIHIKYCISQPLHKELKTLSAYTANNEIVTDTPIFNCNNTVLIELTSDISQTIRAINGFIQDLKLPFWTSPMEHKDGLQALFLLQTMLNRFLRSLISKSLPSTDVSEMKFAITPIHILQALKNDERFDFLTNMHLGVRKRS